MARFSSYEKNQWGKDMNALTNIKSLFMPKTYQTTEGNKTGSWRFLKPRYEEKSSPCSATCPAGEDIAMIEMLAAQGLFKEAWETILRENPLPGICGRVCFHPCEGMCNRKDFDSPLAIHTLERFLADTASRNDLKPSLKKLPPQKEKIAIIGAGPAGLSAGWFLNLLGYACDIYEASSEAGGILRWGIPEYRLPLAVLKNEISRIESMGVRIITDKQVSQAMLEQLAADYSAIFIGCGYARGTPLNIAGENNESVIDGLQFLKKVRLGQNPSCQGISAVIGGGNTAVDIARTAIRLGGSAVILYRRRRQDMPAFEEEVEMALEEGVKLYELLAPSSVTRHGGRYRLTLKKMKIDGVDKDGRGRIVPDGDETSDMDVERIFAATGAIAAESWLIPSFEKLDTIALSHCAVTPGGKGAILAYGGDLVNNTKNVTHAIASGKQAAMALDACFRQGRDAVESRLGACRVGEGESLSMEIYMDGPRRLRSSHVVSQAEINTDYFQFEQRVTQPRLLVEERRGSFDEIDLRISANIAIREAGRCFNCGLCNQCDNCYLFCPDVAVLRGRNMEDRHINYDYCKGCGLCAAECPRNAVTLEEEEV
jgi:2-oxoacid:acceptor oxidoreductase delta subunit (pyruvate/2-ketoisovalerate family)